MALAGWSTYQIAASTSSGNQVLSTNNGGQTIVAVVIEVTRGTTVNANANHAVLCVGASDGTTSRTFSCRAEDNVNPSDTGGRHGQNLIELVNAGNNNANASATFVSFGTNQVTINWSNPPGAAFLMNVTIFWGDLMEAAVRQHSSPSTQNSTNSISGLSFAPNLALVWGRAGGYSATPAGHNDARFCHGMACITEGGTIQQALGSYASEDNFSIATACGNTFRDDGVLQYIDIGPTGSVTFRQRAEVTAFNSDGIDVTTRDYAAAAVGMYLLLYTGGGNRVAISTQDIETATTGTGAAKKITTGWKPAAVRSIASGFNRV